MGRVEDSIYLIGDPHFGHRNILGYCERPFEDIDHMNEAIMDNINSVVKKTNTLYILGDFALSKKENVIRWINEIKCENKSIVLGNHDEYSARWYMENGFTWASRFPIIMNQFLILSHEPLFLVPNDVRVNLHGHVHASLPYRPSNLYFNLSADVINFVPVTLGRIMDEIKADNRAMEDGRVPFERRGDGACKRTSGNTPDIQKREKVLPADKHTKPAVQKDTNGSRGGGRTRRRKQGVQEGVSG